ncbi:MAG: hypothetical protein ACREL6_13160, partial [Gemmatimonadales bacterium]
MRAVVAKTVTAIGVMGSLASVVALFISSGGGASPTVTGDSMVPVSTAARTSAEPLALPRITDLLFSESRELL